MRYGPTVLLGAVALGILGLLEAQRPFKQYEAAEYVDFPLPPGLEPQAETDVRIGTPLSYGTFDFGPHFGE